MSPARRIHRRRIAGLLPLFFCFLAACGEDRSAGEASGDPPPAAEAKPDQPDPHSGSTNARHDYLIEYLKKQGVTAQKPADIDPSIVQPVEGLGEDLQYLIPDGWEQLGSTRLRLVNAMVKNDAGEGEFYAVVMAGKGGDELENVNSWRSEAKLPVLAAKDELAAYCRFKTLPTGIYRIYEFIPEDADTGVVVAIHQRTAETWYFKMRGSTAVLSTALSAFDEFLASLKYE